MHLGSVESFRPDGPAGDALRGMDAAKLPIPQIIHLFAWRADATQHLQKYTQAVMRGPSELSPGQRELIAAFVSGKNQCLF
jgi:alkylhydroperoxidase family enzyme